MSGMHGMFSLGGMAGAVTGGAALAAGLAPQSALDAGRRWRMALAVAAVRRDGCCRRDATAFASRRPTGFRLPRGALVILGVLAALGLIAEGAIYDWSVLYLQQELGSPQQQAALAYASFSAAMAAARFGGDAMRARFAPAPLLRGSALLAAASHDAGAADRSRPGSPWSVSRRRRRASPTWCRSCSQPSARVPGVEPARGIAAVSAAAYLGFMAGPPVIGFLAQAQFADGGALCWWSPSPRRWRHRRAMRADAELIQRSAGTAAHRAHRGIADGGAELLGQLLGHVVAARVVDRLLRP